MIEIKTSDIFDSDKYYSMIQEIEKYDSFLGTKSTFVIRNDSGEIGKWIDGRTAHFKRSAYWEKILEVESEIHEKEELVYIPFYVRCKFDSCRIKKFIITWIEEADKNLKTLNPARAVLDTFDGSRSIQNKSATTASFIEFCSIEEMHLPIADYMNYSNLFGIGNEVKRMHLYHLESDKEYVMDQNVIKYHIDTVTDQYDDSIEHGEVYSNKKLYWTALILATPSIEKMIKQHFPNITGKLRGYSLERRGIVISSLDADGTTIMSRELPLEDVPIEFFKVASDYYMKLKNIEYNPDYREKYTTG